MPWIPARTRRNFLRTQSVQTVRFSRREAPLLTFGKQGRAPEADVHSCFDSGASMPSMRMRVVAPDAGSYASVSPSTTRGVPRTLILTSPLEAAAACGITETKGSGS